MYRVEGSGDLREASAGCLWTNFHLQSIAANYYYTYNQLPPPMTQFKQQQHIHSFTAHEQTTQPLFSPSYQKHQSADQCLPSENKFKKHSQLHNVHSVRSVSSDETEEQAKEKKQKYTLHFDILLAQTTEPMLIHSAKQPAVQQSNWINFEQSEAKLVSDLKITMKCDKYLRLITSVLKTYRAFHPKNRVNKVYKEIVLARRVIRFESKYDTLIDLLTNKDSKWMVLFKLFQLTGDLTDFTAFWLKVKHEGTKKCEKLIDNLEQLESDFYFFECCIWLCIYSYRIATVPKQAKGSSEEGAKAERKAVENKLKAAKYLLDVLTSYSNSSLKSMLGEINPKLAGLFTFFSSCIAIYILWR